MFDKIKKDITQYFEVKYILELLEKSKYELFQNNNDIHYRAVKGYEYISPKNNDIHRIILNQIKSNNLVFHIQNNLKRTYLGLEIDKYNSSLLSIEFSDLLKIDSIDMVSYKKIDFNKKNIEIMLRQFKGNNSANYAYYTIKFKSTFQVERDNYLNQNEKEHSIYREGVKLFQSLKEIEQPELNKYILNSFLYKNTYPITQEFKDIITLKYDLNLNNNVALDFFSKDLSQKSTLHKYKIIL